MMDEKFYEKPSDIKDSRFRYDSFNNDEAIYGRKGRLPAMGWNSWNAFGSGNTEALTKIMADRLIELGLDKIGYKYMILDDGCYGASRIDGHLTSDEMKFPGGFKNLSDYIHDKGLKFGMYNDIGSRLCSGLEVGICGYEETDTEDYIRWGVDYLKVDNCYNVWDNATFSNPENAKFTFAPDIRGIRIVKANDDEDTYVKSQLAADDGIIIGQRAYVVGDYVTGIGTYDGTGPDTSPVGNLSSELWFNIISTTDADYDLYIDCRCGAFEGTGAWLQVSVHSDDSSNGVDYIAFDGFVSETASYDLDKSFGDWNEAGPIKIHLKEGDNIIRLMNHRRQENTLTSYAKIQEYLNKADPENDIIFSICEWGKTQPQNWGYKVGDSWRILNDITFQVGADGDRGYASWEGAYTTSITAQYNKAVIMDGFAGLGKGWNDPDMLVIGMNGITDTMCKTHMTMWCMMNSPLMLGMDLRNISKGDELYKIISNEEIIALNQDSLGVQAKRIYTTKAVVPDTSYIRDNDRVDVLAKPLSDGSIALSFINVSLGERKDNISIRVDLIMDYLKNKMINPKEFAEASSYMIKDLWSKKSITVDAETVRKKGFYMSMICNEINDTASYNYADTSDKKKNGKALTACDNLTFRITPI